MASADDLYARLAEPFPQTELEWRIQQSGLNRESKPWAKVVAYVQARAIMARLDLIVGPENWRDEYRPWVVGGTAGVLCGLSLRVPHPTGQGDEWITKWDGAEPTQIEPVKGGLSAALKRAAVKWGIGRYLYGLEEGWAQIVDKNARGPGGPAINGCIKWNEKKGGARHDPVYYWWLPPNLPAWAICESERPGGKRPPVQQPTTVTNPPAGPVGHPPDDVHAPRPAPPVQQPTTVGTTTVANPPANNSGGNSRQNAAGPGTAAGSTGAAGGPPASNAGRQAANPPVQQPAAAAVTPPADFDPIVATRKLMMSCGARSAADADLIVLFVTAGTVKTFEEAKSLRSKALDAYQCVATACANGGEAALLMRARTWYEAITAGKPA